MLAFSEIYHSSAVSAISARGLWEILGFGWNRGAGRAGALLGTWMLAATDLPKEPSQGILTAHRPPGAAWQWTAWGVFTLHGPLKKHQDGGPMWPVGSLPWAAAPDWKSGFHQRLVPAFPWRSGPEAPTYLGMVS